MNDKLFIHKYQPLYFIDFGIETDIIQMLKALILIDNLNILFIGNIASGKTSFLNALIKEYYIEFVPRQMESFDYSAYWKSEIKRKIPYIDFNFFYHYGFSSGTIRINMSNQDIRKMKLEKLKIYE